MVATILDSRGGAGAVEHSRRCGAAAMRCDASSGDLRNARISIERELQYRKRTDDTQDLQDDTSLAHSLCPAIELARLGDAHVEDYLALSSNR